MFAEVAFPISSYQTFTYQVPAALEARITTGVRVKAPLGKRLAQGIVVACPETPGFSGRLRPLTSLVDELPVLDEHLWELLLWISRYYRTPLGLVARTALPRNLSARYHPPLRLLVAPVPGRTGEVLKRDSPAQARVWEHIRQQSAPVPVNSLGRLASNPAQICRKLAELGLVSIRSEVRLPELGGLTFDPVPKTINFSEDQQAVLQTLEHSLESRTYQPFLLHGVTGSGKTEVYVQLARRTLEQGRTVIILLPEISLTPQIAGRFRAVFGETVALWHSRLSQAARAWTWKQICAGKYRVVIGARSAVFTPLRRLGLVVVDEEQEQSYKQESPEPRYHARDVALMRGKLQQALVILSSATPSLESYYNQIQGKISGLTLTRRYGGARIPQVHVVDMLREQEESGKLGQVFSGFLQDRIEKRLRQGEQIILLQNRRGYAPILRCRDCGWIFMCPHCQMSLAYHRAGEHLQCHFCGYRLHQIPGQCRTCQGPNLKLVGTGTQKVEDLIRECFPAARLARLDVDVTRSGTSLSGVLQRFARGEYDILLGTQMIAKGLDFENATLVGIVNADVGLYFPDFRAGERVFQLIYQAAGRAGRHRKPGEVVIQTYNAENPVIKHAARLNLAQFYNITLSERLELNYPPFSWIVRIECYGRGQKAVETQAGRIRQGLRGLYKGLEILGPAPCYRERLRGNYRIQLVLKSVKDSDPGGKKLHHFLEQNFAPRMQMVPGVRLLIDIDPVTLL